MKLAYGRVSAKGQTPARLLVKFRELGIEDRFIFVDKQSGKKGSRLPGRTAYDISCNSNHKEISQ